MSRRLQLLSSTLLLAVLAPFAVQARGAVVDDATGGPTGPNTPNASATANRGALANRFRGATVLAADPHARDRLLTQGRRGVRARRAVVARQAWDRQVSLDRRRAGQLQAALARAAWDRQLARYLEAASRVRQAAAEVSAPPSGTISAGGGLVSVRGIVVDASIADRLQALLAQADAAGIALSGAGHRDPAAQRRLREQHCPDPVNSPPSACSPATARPGESMHEQGVAIDFTSGGSLVSSRGNAAYQWLAAHATQFGFINLPSEPWHWSINGN